MKNARHEPHEMMIAIIDPQKGINQCNRLKGVVEMVETLDSKTCQF